MSYALYIEPAAYTSFASEAEQIDQCKDWGLLSEKAVKSKAFHYKGSGQPVPCTIVGYVDQMTAVIKLDQEQLHCIHPSYLKEMQAVSFGSRAIAVTAQASEANESALLASAEREAESLAALVDELTLEQPVQVAQAPAAPSPAEAGELAASAEAAAAPAKTKAKKERAPKLQLPEEKVAMRATIAEFTTVPNHFADEDDEVIVYEEVVMTVNDVDTEVGSAWSSYSATLKKLELQEGDVLTFEAKIVAKKLTRHPVPYKINNPSKLKKQEA
ncbi:hypothetical protein ACFO9Q_17960 [Paenibacillus sp. GCM10023252]|uniref:hypothetical protein n=1 Tax=Paenibacillus sp. GCM10023252 TaxID=3252649 RepID=UPI00361254BC